METKDRAILDYLKSRGFKQTEQTLRLEAQLTNSTVSPEYILFQKDSQDPLEYEKSYAQLRKWTMDSIDFYKSELEPVLYPIFVHAFLDLVSKGLKENAKKFLETFKSDHLDMHTHDIQRLAGIMDPSHVLENPLSQSYRTNRYGIVMSRYPFELLLGYLQDQGFLLLLRIVNQYLNIQVTQDKPSDRQHVQEKTAGLIGTKENISSLISEFPVCLGKLPEDVVFVKEVEKQLLANIRDDQAVMNEFKKWQATDPDSPDPMVSVPVPPKRLIDIESEIKTLKQLSERVALGPSSLPSICAYTFHNTRDGYVFLLLLIFFYSLNSLDISEDGSLVAGGFSDSYLKIWNLAADSFIPQKNTMNDMKVDKSFSEASVRLIGHSGPVYASSFSPDNRFMISCSEDKTARLWSMDTFSNLVVYKGHNYPIWDVDVGPLGFYFATASHDRTARLWSTDHIYTLRIFVGHLSDVDVCFFPIKKISFY